MVTFVPWGNERQRLQMEHEMNVPRLILGQQRPPPATPGQAISKERAFCCVQFYPVMSATSSYQSSIPINPGMDEVSLDSDSSSFTTL